MDSVRAGEGMIHVVEFEKAFSLEPKTLMEIYPLPWSTGFQNESQCDIIAANGLLVTSLHGGGILHGVSPGQLAKNIPGILNSFHAFQSVDLSPRTTQPK